MAVQRAKNLNAAEMDLSYLLTGRGARTKSSRAISNTVTSITWEQHEVNESAKNDHWFNLKLVFLRFVIFIITIIMATIHKPLFGSCCPPSEGTL